MVDADLITFVSGLHATHTGLPLSSYTVSCGVGFTILCVRVIFSFRFTVSSFVSHLHRSGLSPKYVVLPGRSIGIPIPIDLLPLPFLGLSCFRQCLIGRALND